jgi:hypothetical protein
MVSHLVYYQLALCALVWLFVMLHVTGSKPGPPTPPAPAIYLHTADKYHEFTQRPSPGQKGMDERAIMTSQWPSYPW